MEEIRQLKRGVFRTQAKLEATSEPRQFGKVEHLEEIDTLNEFCLTL